MNLSPEQLQIVTSSYQKSTVQAGAGAGKTRVLVERFLWLLENYNLQADQVLTITFTKKAAIEMKRRIVTALLEKNLPEQAQLAETGPIQTIHSFCERVLRENPIPARIDPQFEILSSERAVQLFDQALETILINLNILSRESHVLVNHLIGEWGFNEPKHLHSKIAKSCRQTLAQLRSSGHTFQDLQQKYPDLNSYRTQIISTLEKTLELNPSHSSSLEEWYGLTLQAFQDTPTLLPKWFAPITENDHLDLQYSFGLLHLTLAVWKELYRLMEEKQAFDFNELEARTIQLLNQKVPLSSQYQAILVDEAQDVNQLQYKIIEALNTSIEMMVGDPQQSIYKFRYADVSLFYEKIKQNRSYNLQTNYRSDPNLLRFVSDLFRGLWKENFQPMQWPQSQKVTDSEDPFESTHSTGEIDIHFSTKFDPYHVAEQVEHLIQNGNHPKDITILVRQTNAAVRISECLESKNIPCQIIGGAETFYTRLEIRDMANLLQSLSDPDNLYALLCTLHGPAVGLSLETALTYLQQKPLCIEEFKCPKEELSLYQNFINWFIPLQKSIHTLSAWESISEIFTFSPLFENLAKHPDRDQLIPNIRKLLTLAIEEPQMDALEFAQNIRNIQQIKHREGDAPMTREESNTVSLMTIHKSKGLEFPIVIVPDLYQKIYRIPYDPLLHVDTGLVSTPYAPLPSTFFRLLCEQKQVADTQEELRVLYVALTRAQKKLYLYAHPSKNSPTLAGLINKTLNLDPKSQKRYTKEN